MRNLAIFLHVWIVFSKENNSQMSLQIPYFYIQGPRTRKDSIPHSSIGPEVHVPPKKLRTKKNKWLLK